MDMRRRRSMSKGREQTADERLDALVEEARASATTKEPARRAQSLEPSRMLTPSLRKTSSALTAGASRERHAPEQVRAIENREREVPREPQGPPMSFLPVVPPLPTGSLPPPVPGHRVGGQVGGHEGGGGGAPSLLQPAQEQAWGMLAGLGTPLPGMWGERGSQSQMPILPGQREAGGPMRGTSMEAEPVASGRLAVQDYLPERGMGKS